MLVPEEIPASETGDDERTPEPSASTFHNTTLPAVDEPAAEETAKEGWGSGMSAKEKEVLAVLATGKNVHTDPVPSKEDKRELKRPGGKTTANSRERDRADPTRSKTSLESRTNAKQADRRAETRRDAIRAKMSEATKRVKEGKMPKEEYDALSAKAKMELAKLDSEEKKEDNRDKDGKERKTQPAGDRVNQTELVEQAKSSVMAQVAEAAKRSKAGSITKDEYEAVKKNAQAKLAALEKGAVQSQGKLDEDQAKPSARTKDGRRPDRTVADKKQQIMEDMAKATKLAKEGNMSKEEYEKIKAKGKLRMAALAGEEARTGPAGTVLPNGDGSSRYAGDRSKAASQRGQKGEKAEKVKETKVRGTLDAEAGDKVVERVLGERRDTEKAVKKQELVQVAKNAADPVDTPSSSHETDIKRFDSVGTSAEGVSEVVTWPQCLLSLATCIGKSFSPESNLAALIAQIWEESFCKRRSPLSKRATASIPIYSTPYLGY